MVWRLIASDTVQSNLSGYRITGTRHWLFDRLANFLCVVHNVLYAQHACCVARPLSLRDRRLPMHAVWSQSTTYGVFNTMRHSYHSMLRFVRLWSAYFLPPRTDQHTGHGPLHALCIYTIIASLRRSETATGPKPVQTCHWQTKKHYRC